ncbi:MAG: STAS domain-containing protein [Negativicutes bacterium]|nr:STAS domain-containing protein [Negativicutes bacterium]
MEKIVEGRTISLKVNEDVVATNLYNLVETAKAYVESSGEFEQLVLDMSNVGFVDSKGITFVVGLYKMANARGSKFKVVKLRPEIHELFTLLNLNQLFSIEKV